MACGGPERAASPTTRYTAFMTAQASHSSDITLFGATGFVGKLTAQALAANASEGLRITLAGRNPVKLQAVADAVSGGSAHISTQVVDATNAADVRALAAGTKVVVSTAGPYAALGLPVVLACAENGTHYADLTGEVSFMHRSIGAAHTIAQRTGARIVHACGFDSIPSDLAVYETVRLAHKSGAQITAIEAQYRRVEGGLSGGTVSSLIGEAALGRTNPEAKRVQADPFSLCEDASLWAVRGAAPDLFSPVKGHGGQWLAPFIMSAANSRVVRRSLSLLHDPRKNPLTYREAMALGTSRLAAVKAAGMATAVRTLTTTLRTKATAAAFAKVFPSPGQGPKSAHTGVGGFDVHTFARAQDGRVFRTVVSCDEDPGYVATSKMLAACGVLLTRPVPHAAACPSGVLTPSAAFGKKLSVAMRDAGLYIQTHAAPNITKSF